VPQPGQRSRLSSHSITHREAPRSKCRQRFTRRSLISKPTAPHPEQTRRRRRRRTVTTTPSPPNATSSCTDAPGSLSIRLVESSRGAVSVFQPTRFPDPLPEPDMRLPTHPALHRPRCQSLVLVVVVRSVHGFGIFVPR
jgi:hypothetical protein